MKSGPPHKNLIPPPTLDESEHVELVDENWLMSYSDMMTLLFGLFVLLYTLMPLPSTPLFTAAGMARMRTLTLIPSFFVGKFISDAIMVLTGDYLAHNVGSITQGLLSWKTLLGTVLGLVLLSLFLFTNWRRLWEEKKFGMSFNIWK